MHRSVKLLWKNEKNHGLRNCLMRACLRVWHALPDGGRIYGNTALYGLFVRGDCTYATACQRLVSWVRTCVYRNMRFGFAFRGVAVLGYASLYYVFRVTPAC